MYHTKKVRVKRRSTYLPALPLPQSVASLTHDLPQLRTPVVRQRRIKEPGHGLRPRLSEFLKAVQQFYLHSGTGSCIRSSSTPRVTCGRNPTSTRIV